MAFPFSLGKRLSLTFSFKLHFNWQPAFAFRVAAIYSTLHRLRTSGPRLRQQLLHDIIVRNVLGHSRILHELLLDGNTNVMTCQQLLQLLEGLHGNNNRKSTLEWSNKNPFCGRWAKVNSLHRYKGTRAVSQNKQNIIIVVAANAINVDTNDVPIVERIKLEACNC